MFETSRHQSTPLRARRNQVGKKYLPNFSRARRGVDWCRRGRRIIKLFVGSSAQTRRMEVTFAVASEVRLRSHGFRSEEANRGNHEEWHHTKTGAREEAVAGNSRDCCHYWSDRHRPSERAT